MTAAKFFRGRVAATLEAVDQLCSQLRRGELVRIPQGERFAVELLLREALTNAVVHAAEADEVWCEVELLAHGIAVRVEDNGNGFDWRRHMRATSAAAGESGRGVPILRRYSSALRFNEKGNSVEAIRVFQQGDGNA